MQIIRIQTNIRNVDISEKFEHEVSYNLSKVMDIPSDKFIVIIEPALRITSGLGAKNTPIAVVNLQTTRPTSQSENDRISETLSQVFREFLKLDSSNLLISFDYKDAKNFAIQGKTIASLYS